MLAALAALIPVLPIAIGLLIGSGQQGAAVARAPSYTALPNGTQNSSLSALPPSASGGSGALVALVRRRTTIRGAPGGRALGQLPIRTEFGSPEVLWVVARAPGWLGVISPLAGNGHVGWIPESESSLNRVPWELRVSLSARRLTVLQGGKVLRRYAIAVGRPDAPTPTGRFAVTDRLATGDPTGPYGCCILALSARSPHAIQDWTGGNRIAIHSTPDSSSIGQAVSHGCMRLTLAQGQWLLGHVPLGTPTLISG